MDVTKQLVKDFVEVTGGTSRTNTNVYGTLVKNGNSICVRIDGSDEITPINASLVALPETIDEDDPDRVTLEIKNHQTVVTGNLKNKAIGTEQGEQYQTGIGKLENTINGLTYTDADGVVRISRGSIVLTGSITFDDMDDTTKEAAMGGKSQFSPDGVNSWTTKMHAVDKYRRDWDYNTESWGTAYQFRGTDAAIPAYITNTIISEGKIQAPYIMATEFGVYPSSEEDIDGSFNIYGNYRHIDPNTYENVVEQFHFFEIRYAYGDFPEVTISSPDGASINMGDPEGGNYFYMRGTFDFSEATVLGISGATATFA